MKKTIIGIFFIGLFLMASSTSASDAWWNTSYQCRIPITLTGNTSGAQTDYQLMLNVSYDSNMRSDFDDLRFTDDNGNLINAWLEDKTDNFWANIWIKFSYTPNNNETKTYYIYYENINVSNYWNGTNTFEFFDDFEYSGTPNSLKWVETYGNGAVYTTIHNVETVDEQNVYHAQQSSDADAGARIVSIQSWNEGIVEGIFRIRSASGNVHDAGIETDKYTGCQPYHYWGGGAGCSGTNTLGNFKIQQIFKNDGIANCTAWDLTTGELFCTGSTSGLTPPYKIQYDFRTGDDGQSDTDVDNIHVRKYAVAPPTYELGSEEEYTPPPPPPPPTPTPTPLEEIISSNYVIQNQTLYITKPCNLQYKITSNSFVYGGLRNINTVICDNNNTVISGWFKISTDKTYDCDYNFFINVNDTSYQSKIVTLKQDIVDSSIISKIYRRTCLIDGYEIYSYNTTVYIVSILPNPIYFYFNLEDRTIQFGDKQFNNQTLVFNQLNFDDQYYFMDNASRDTIVMKFKAVNPSVKSGAELKGLTGILLNALSKIPFIGKSFKNVLYYPLFFIQTIFNFAFTFLDIIVNDWWYALMLLEIVCIFSASRQTGYANIMEVYINTHVKIIQFIYEVIILNMINLIIKIVVTIKDMIKWW